MDVKLNHQTGKLDVSPSYDWHIGRQILKKLKETENKIHQIEVVSGAEETRGSVRSRIIRLAQALIARDLKVGDVILVCAVNHNDANIPLLASLCIGAITVNLVVGMKQSEISHVMSTAKPKIIFSDPEMLDVIVASRDELGLNAEIVAFGPDDGKYTNFTELVSSITTERKFKCVDFDPETTDAFIICTSGTTGLPKLVVIKHKMAILTWMAPMYLDENVGILRFGCNKVVYFNLSPSYWITGLGSVLGSCLYGIVRLQTAKPFSVEIFRRTVEKYKPDSFIVNPFSMSLICKHPEFSTFDMSSVRTVFVGGMMIDYGTVKLFESRLPNGIVAAVYCASEAGFVSSNPGFLNKSVGKFYPWYQWKIVDDTERILGPNQPGELRIKSDYIMKYFNDKKATDQAFDRDGYYKTGDLFYYDYNENFYVIDRVKDVIKYCNYQVGASEIEYLINNMPGIVSSAVIGVPDPVYGSLPLAYVQKLPESDITEEDIKNQVKSQLSDFKQLRGGVIFLPEIPKTHTGKINRNVLKSLKTSQKT